MLNTPGREQSATPLGFHTRYISPQRSDSVPVACVSPPWAYSHPSSFSYQVLGFRQHLRPPDRHDVLSYVYGSADPVWRTEDRISTKGALHDPSWLIQPDHARRQDQVQRKLCRCLLAAASEFSGAVGLPELPAQAGCSCRRSTIKPRVPSYLRLSLRGAIVLGRTLAMGKLLTLWRPQPQTDLQASRRTLTSPHRQGMTLATPVGSRNTCSLVVRPLRSNQVCR